jgi:hypothetical protein
VPTAGLDEAPILIALMSRINADKAGVSCAQNFSTADHGGTPCRASISASSRMSPTVKRPAKRSVAQPSTTGCTMTGQVGSGSSHVENTSRPSDSFHLGKD